MWAVLCVLALVLAHATSAGGEATARAQHAAEGGTPAGSWREAALETRVEEQDRLFRQSREDYGARIRAAYKGRASKGSRPSWVDGLAQVKVPARW